MTQSLRVLFVLPILVLLLSGCQSPRAFFQMDSNSPSPFFGLDLKLPQDWKFRSSSEPLTPKHDDLEDREEDETRFPLPVAAEEDQFASGF